MKGCCSHFDNSPLQTQDPDPVRREIAARAAASRYGEGGKEEEGNGMASEGNRVYPRSQRRRSLVVDPPDGRIPLLANKFVYYNKDAKQDSYENHIGWERCMGRGMPGAYYRGGYGNGFRIVQSPGWVVMHPEMIHDTRMIPVDGRPHVGPDVHLYNGDPVGHWEGQ